MTKFLSCGKTAVVSYNSAMHGLGFFDCKLIFFKRVHETSFATKLAIWLPPSTKIQCKLAKKNLSASVHAIYKFLLFVSDQS